MESLLKRAKQLVPPLLESFHKGQAGRILVIGGSKDYTGSPYFACMSAMIFGADLVTCICESAAAPVIKSYSPDLIIRPLESISNQEQNQNAISEIIKKAHAVVIGPGLGESSSFESIYLLAISAARDADLPLVIDADAIKLVIKKLDIIKGYSKAVLTPNANEFRLLVKALGLEGAVAQDSLCCKISKALDGVVVLEKGQTDKISNDQETLEVNTPGGLKRVAGQGDLLCGVLATMLAWREFYLQKQWEHSNELDSKESILLASLLAATVTRTASRLAFKDKGRATITSDILQKIGLAYDKLI